MQPLPLFLLLLCSSLSVFAQNGHWKTGASEAGIANSTAAFQGENFLFHNVGVLGTASTKAVSFNYDYRGYVKGLNNVSLQYIHPTNKFNYGLAIFKSGDEVLNEFVASVGIGQQMGIAGLGIKANYYQMYTQEYGYTRAYSMSIGGIAELFKGFYWGTYIDNPIQFSESHESIYLPILITTGIAYKPVDHLLLAATAEKEAAGKFIFSTGISYDLIPEIILRTGINWQYKHMYYGFGFFLKRYSINYALAPVTILGNVHSLTLQVKFNTVEK